MNAKKVSELKRWYLEDKIPSFQEELKKCVELLTESEAQQLENYLNQQNLIDQYTEIYPSSSDKQYFDLVEYFSGPDYKIKCETYNIENRQIKWAYYNIQNTIFMLICRL